MASETVRDSLESLRDTILIRLLERRDIPVNQARLRELDWETPIAECYRRLTASRDGESASPPPVMSIPDAANREGNQRKFWLVLFYAALTGLILFFLIVLR